MRRRAGGEGDGTVAMRLIIWLLLAEETCKVCQGGAFGGGKFWMTKARLVIRLQTRLSQLHQTIHTMPGDEQV